MKSLSVFKNGHAQGHTCLLHKKQGALIQRFPQDTNAFFYSRSKPPTASQLQGPDGFWPLGGPMMTLNAAAFFFDSDVLFFRLSPCFDLVCHQPSCGQVNSGIS